MRLDSTQAMVTVVFSKIPEFKTYEGQGHSDVGKPFPEIHRPVPVLRGNASDPFGIEHEEDGARPKIRGIRYQMACSSGKPHPSNQRSTTDPVIPFHPERSVLFALVGPHLFILRSHRGRKKLDLGIKLGRMEGPTNKGEEPSKKASTITTSSSGRKGKEYVPAEAAVGFTGIDASPTPFVIDIPVREPYSDDKVPWTYEGGVGNLEQKFGVMGITRSGRVYENPTTTNKGKAPVAETEAIPGVPPTPPKKVTEEEAEAFMKIIKASEYKVVEQMAKSPAHISLLALLFSSESHREALLWVLTAALVPKGTSPNRIEETINSIFSNTISFSDDELPSEGCAHSRALYIVCKCNNHIVGRVMIDNGSALNRHIPSADIPNAFSLLLERPWIHSAGAIPSSLHQKLKFIVEKRIITVKGEEDYAIYKETTVPYISGLDEDSQVPEIEESLRRLEDRQLTSLEPTEEINEGTEDEPCTLKIGTGLDPTQRARMIDFLTRLRLNPTKCTFGARSGKLLGFVKAFNTVKEYLVQPSVLVPPTPGRPLVLYLTVRRQSLGCMLGQEEESIHTEHAIYYLSKKFIDGESNYPEIEKMCCALVWVMQRLRQYTLYHTIRLLSKTDPLKYLLDSPSSMRNIAKWRCQLTEYDIEYVSRTSVKGQAIADHLAEFPIEDSTPINPNFPDEEILQVDCAHPNLISSGHAYAMPMQRGLGVSTFPGTRDGRT
ncbi:hypothetical protein CRG98_009126 [Punica granatum]|uniref:Reverse transcriptase RNase H-like domain-containing protein n=1 Tax=Punica granatum TaxID=22663 RepID=A0A2I0KPT3_PUNGR|nr:hypothetical protein CRG98_009126 [Punica granatum]